MTETKTTPRTTAPYGSWKSPLASTDVSQAGMRLSEISQTRGDLFWLERRPNEGGRNALVYCPGGDPSKRIDVVAEPYNVRNRTHEYGGGSYCVVPRPTPNGELAVYFTNFQDQRIHRCIIEGNVESGQTFSEPEAITPKRDELTTYADLVYDAKHDRLIAVCEAHQKAGKEGALEPLASLVGIGPLKALEAITQTELFSSSSTADDFVASPRISPDGDQVAWLTWRHPNLPWDETVLYVAANEATELANPTAVAGKDLVESIFQPEWSPSGDLHFVSDRSGYWNLYRKTPDQDPLALAPRAADFGMAQWVFRMSTYAFADDHRIVCCWCDNGLWHCGVLDTGSGNLEEVTSSYTVFDGPTAGETGKVNLLAASPMEAPVILEIDVSTVGTGTRVVFRPGADDETIDPGDISIGEPIEFPVAGGKTAHAFYYPPQNHRFCATLEDLPPLIVKSHGGPTALATNEYQGAIQYWTTRGFAVADVNYRGSTGFGREYRQSLNGRWGISDVEDCCAVAEYLVGRGLADSERLAIRGGSAGGYTTLAALVFRDVFKAGASHYGIGNLEALARDTHKFEARYLDSMIGPYPARRDLYIARSPIHHVDGLSCPVIFFQGLEDRIVPPNQAEAMVAALEKKGIPVAYVPFEGEQHGFRRAENIERSLDGELYFYSRVFGFDLAEEVDPIEIRGL